MRQEQAQWYSMTSRRDGHPNRILCYVIFICSPAHQGFDTYHIPSHIPIWTQCQVVACFSLLVSRRRLSGPKLARPRANPMLQCRYIRPAFGFRGKWYHLRKRRMAEQSIWHLRFVPYARNSSHFYILLIYPSYISWIFCVWFQKQDIERWQLK